MMRSVLLLFLSLMCSTGYAANFDAQYRAKVGDFNGDGLTDIYLQHQPSIVPIELDGISVPIPTSRRDVGEFVLQQGAGGTFSAVGGISSSQLTAMRGWPASAIRTIVSDVNLDGNQDLALRNVSSAISGGLDGFVYAPSTSGQIPNFKALDASFLLFIRDIDGWLKDRTYFNSGLYYELQSGYLEIAYFDCEGASYEALADDPGLDVLFAECEYLGSYFRTITIQVLRFNPAGFSGQAVDVLNYLAEYIQTGQISASEANAAKVALSNVLGVPVGTATTAADVATATAARGVGQVLLEVLGVFVRGTSVIGGILYPSSVGDGELSESQIRQAEAALFSVAREAARSRRAGFITLYHGTDLASATRLLNGEPLDAVAAMENRNYPRADLGFYLATDYGVAENFAFRAAGLSGGAVVLLYEFTEDAFNAVTLAGGKFRRIVDGMNFPGYEYLVPVRAFPVFNVQRSSGQIMVSQATDPGP